MAETDHIAGGDDLPALIRLIRRLRGEDGCPWDRKQTARTLTPYIIEESYELVDAIESRRDADVCEELGDVLFQVLFMVEVYQEQNRFGLEDVIRGIIDKMIRRHPHVFGENQLDSGEAVRAQWHAIKKAEKKNQPPVSVLDSIPAGLPPLARAYRVSERAVREGFEWPDLAGVLDQTEEEWREFKEELDRRRDRSDDRHLKLEFGDILFTLVNVARVAGIHPETSLVGSIAKFERRFRLMEELAAGRGTTLNAISREALEKLWSEVKAILPEEE